MAQDLNQTSNKIQKMYIQATPTEMPMCLTMFIGRRWIIYLLAALPSFSVIADATPPQMNDPFLGLLYDPETVHFQPCPKALHDSLSLSPGQYWIFAEYVDPANPTEEYWVLNGLTHVQFDTDPPKNGPLEADFGVVAIRASGVSKVIGAPDGGLAPFHLSTKVVNGLYKDAAKRLLQAFGQKQLQSAIVKQLNPYTVIEYSLVKALEDEHIRFPAIEGS